MRLRRLLFLAPVVLAACGLLTIEVAQDAETTVEGAGILGELLGTVAFSGLDSFDVTVTQALEDQDVEPGDLVSVRLTTLTLAGDPDLAFLDRFDLYVSAEGLPEVLVASGEDFPEDDRAQALVLEDVELAPYVTAGGLAFRVDASGAAPVDDTVVKAHVEADVEASVQGACRQVKARQ